MCEKLLIKSFDAQEDEIMDFFDDLEHKIFTYTSNILKKIFRDINKNLLRKFNKLFKHDSEGKPRNWKVMEEVDIKEEYNRAKTIV